MTARSTAQADADTIKNETAAGANTHTRVGTMLRELTDGCVFTEDVGSTVCAEGDSRLSNARTPTAHATSHKAGGTDEIKLHEFGAPTEAVAFNSQKATGLADPSSQSQDAATAKWVDASSMV